MKSAKLFWGLACLLVLASNLWSMSGWNEARGVYDDVCYLRQAHLFQRFGLGGLNTDIARDDDRYLTAKLKAIAYPDWNDPAAAPCHTQQAATQKMVIQYPPGTGALLALFPEGHQVVPLYAAATLLVFGFALLAILSARAVPQLVLAGAFGCLAIYLMINPTKASYSMAPTMVACALIGYLTVRWLTAQRRNVALTVALGLLLGLSVNFRLPNLFLASGYVLFLIGAFLRARTRETFGRGIAFALAMLAGMAPTLASNAINAGSPLTTTYGGADTASPGFSLEIIKLYVKDLQFVLLISAIAAVAFLLRTDRNGWRSVAVMVGANLS